MPVNDLPSGGRTPDNVGPLNRSSAPDATDFHGRLGDAEFQRPRVAGKFLYTGGRKFWVRGVTYGTFRPASNGREYPPPEVVEADFALIAANDLNAIRTYTVPPRWLLDTAQRHGLRVMVGLAWEQHVAFLEDKKRADAIEGRVRSEVRACSGHPAILCYAVGNEIPASIVRWYGPRRVERFIERLHAAAKGEDPGAPVTYVNYPTTEYLELPFLDLACFNVYLESQESLDAYLARLQNLAHDRPLIIAEAGLDSRRHGEAAQARVLDWQIRTGFAAGCAGAFVFAWTDQWYRGGYDIEDWDFGLTRRDRSPKPALAAVRDAFAEVPFPKDLPWPRISVVVCSCNGARTIGDCFEGLRELDYPNFEVIVVDDGSTDATAGITRQYGFRLIRTENRGLGSARNTGLEAATGEIVAYIDDDARPDPHWLTYLADTFLTTMHVGVGGPNFAPPGEGAIADCVANAPGGPTHVLLSDRDAEHIPGCNMAFRKAALQAIREFDPQFRIAGDDVDVCWRLQEQGWTLGFNPSAMVWHHRRNSVRAYWRQQRGYGRAEALLEKKWPEKFNGSGHLQWAGRLYGRGPMPLLAWWRPRIYHGIWGSAAFQVLYPPTPGMFLSLLLMPEWYLVILVLAALSGLGALWRPMLFALPFLAVAVAGPVTQAVLNALRRESTSPATRIARRSLTAFLHLLQPLARLTGRLGLGLTPWRLRGASGFTAPWPRTSTVWSERWQAPTDRLRKLQGVLQAEGSVVLCGGHHDRWDLEVRGGALGAARMRMAVEEHGAGRQFVRVRSWPRCSRGGISLGFLLAGLCLGAAFDRSAIAFGLLSALAVLLLRTLREAGAATAALLRAVGVMATMDASSEAPEPEPWHVASAPGQALVPGHVHQAPQS